MHVTGVSLYVTAHSIIGVEGQALSFKTAIKIVCISASLHVRDSSTQDLRPVKASQKVTLWWDWVDNEDILRFYTSISSFGTSKQI